MNIYSELKLFSIPLLGPDLMNLNKPSPSTSNR